MTEPAPETALPRPTAPNPGEVTPAEPEFAEPLAGTQTAEPPVTLDAASWRRGRLARALGLGPPFRLPFWLGCLILIVGEGILAHVGRILDLPLLVAILLELAVLLSVGAALAQGRRRGWLRGLGAGAIWTFLFALSSLSLVLLFPLGIVLPYWLLEPMAWTWGQSALHFRALDLTKGFNWYVGLLIPPALGAMGAWLGSSKRSD